MNPTGQKAGRCKPVMVFTTMTVTTIIANTKTVTQTHNNFTVVIWCTV